MIKRPLNARFRDAVLHGQKTTTIRRNPWPVGAPIMLYNWAGKPYRSKQKDVAIVVVESTHRIVICERGGALTAVTENGIMPDDFWKHEGFTSRDDFDQWFLPLIPKTRVLHQHLMNFRLLSTTTNIQP